MKIWNIKNSECAGTFDNHEDKVRYAVVRQVFSQSLHSPLVHGKHDLTAQIWALAVDEDGKKVLTAGADSSITIWRDATEEVKEEVKVEAETKMLKWGGGGAEHERSKLRSHYLSYFIRS